MNDNQVENFKKQLFSQINENLSKYESLNHKLIYCAWHNLFESTQVLFKCLKYFSPGVPDRDSMIILLSTNTLSDILNSLLSTCSGFTRGPGIILRGAVENLICIIIISNDPSKYEDYKHDRFDIPSHLSKAKETFPEIGKYYGLLTNTFTHEKYEMSARSFTVGDSFAEFSLLPSLSHIKSNNILLLIISLISRFTGSIIEYCYLNKLTDFYYYRKIDNDHIIEFKDTPGDQLIKNILIENFPDITI